MPEKNLTSQPPAPPLSIQIADDPDQLERAGQFVLALIRKTATAAREAIVNQTGLDASSSVRSNETQPDLRDRAEDAQDSYRKFVDAAALLRAANDEIISLRRALDDKDRALSELKRDSMQMIAFMRALLQLIDGARSQASDDPPPNN